MEVAYSTRGVPIRVPDERWHHISERHPEMRGQLGKVLETVSNPDLILEGDTTELLAIRFYADTPLTSKYMVVVYRETSSMNGFVLTAYFCSQFSKRRAVLWKR